MDRLEIRITSALKDNLKKFAENNKAAVNHLIMAAILEKFGFPMAVLGTDKAIDDVAKLMNNDRYNEITGKQKENAIKDAQTIEYTPEKYIKFIEINKLWADDRTADQYRAYILEDYKSEGLRQKIALIRDFNRRLQSLQQLHRLSTKENHERNNQKITTTD